MWVKERKEANTATCVPMQLSCMFCTCTPKPKMQLKKNFNHWEVAWEVALKVIIDHFLTF